MHCRKSKLQAGAAPSLVISSSSPHCSARFAVRGGAVLCAVLLFRQPRRAAAVGLKQEHAAARPPAASAFRHSVSRLPAILRSHRSARRLRRHAPPQQRACRGHHPRPPCYTTTQRRSQWRCPPCVRRLFFIPPLLPNIFYRARPASPPKALVLATAPLGDAEHKI